MGVLEETGLGTGQRVAQLAQVQVGAMSWWSHDTSMF